IRSLADALPPLGTRVVVFSGGEPLFRPDVFEAAQMFRTRGMTLHLLTSGVLLERSASEVAREFSRVIVSLDATTESLYQSVRGVAALTILERGVARLRRIAPDLPVTARATLHKSNFRELPSLVEHAKAMGLDGISFLPADMFSSAFGRERMPPKRLLALDRDEVRELEILVEWTIAHCGDDFASGFIAETPAKLRRLGQYYRALAGTDAFPTVACDAPYLSLVVEADGAVRPCFFHSAIGNVRSAPLDAIVRVNLRAFRRSLDPATDPVCSRCVCSIKSSWRNLPWQ